MIDFTLTRPDVVLHGTDNGTGPIALLLHAGGERRKVWERFARSLAAHGFRSLAYDQRGHGETEAVDAERLTSFADDVAAMVAAAPGPVTIVGSSLGGLAAILALSDPVLRAEVAGLVLVDVVPDLSGERVRHFLRQTTDALAVSPLVTDILDRVDDLRRSAQGLELPTLLVRGEFGYLSDDELDRFARLVPHASIETVRGAGHLVAQDAPDQLADLVIAHLRTPEVRSRTALADAGHAIDGSSADTKEVHTMTSNRYSALPEPVRLEDTVAELDQRPVPDPEAGRDTDLDFQLRNC